MSGISAVIITRNEAHNIGRCLASLKGLVDETVVVDSGSTDATREIAAQHGAQVVVRAWTNYADQKNHANRLASRPYLLSMDADEEISTELRRSLEALLRIGLQNAYSFNRLTNYCGHWVRHGGWYPDVKVRLFPKEGSHWVGDHVHETLEMRSGTTITHLRGDLLHYSYRNKADHLERIERYSELHARSLFEEGRQAPWIKRVFAPVVKFLQGYLVELGFLDGTTGWQIAWISARAVRLKYEKLNALRRAQRS